MRQFLVSALLVHWLMMGALLQLSSGEAPSLVITPGDAWVRAGLAFRCRATSATPTSDPLRGPYRLHLGLVQGGVILAEADLA